VPPVTVSREGHPSRFFGHNRRSAAASLQVELRNLDGNKLSDQPDGETNNPDIPEEAIFRD